MLEHTDEQRPCTPTALHSLRENQTGKVEKTRSLWPPLIIFEKEAISAEPAGYSE